MNWMAFPGSREKHRPSHRWWKPPTGDCGLRQPRASHGWIQRRSNENRNRLPPPVIISAVISDGKTYAGSNGLTLPAHTENLEIDYTALSLAIPERVLFRYKLDGVDNEWQNVGTRRQAYYTKLRPGTLQIPRNCLQ